ncbi:MAG: hypothetical protein AAGA87_08595 [Pseudomonadota bacterium]
MSIVTALLLVHSTDAAAQDYSLDQLLRIESLILSKDANGLLRYFRENPEVLAGNDSFAQEMRSLQFQLERELRTQFRGGPGRQRTASSQY